VLTADKRMPRSDIAGQGSVKNKEEKVENKEEEPST
jgi:hypothetical protein